MRHRRSFFLPADAKRRMWTAGREQYHPKNTLRLSCNVRLAGQSRSTRPCACQKLSAEAHPVKFARGPAPSVGVVDQPKGGGQGEAERKGTIIVSPLSTRRARPRRVKVCYFFFFVCARSEAIGARSCFGVFGLRKSLPACEATFLEVDILKVFPFPPSIEHTEHFCINMFALI